MRRLQRSYETHYPLLAVVILAVFVRRRRDHLVIALAEAAHAHVTGRVRHS